MLLALTLAGAVIAAYGRIVVLEPTRFADRVTNTLDDRGVRAIVTDRVTDSIVRGAPPGVRAVVEPVVARDVEGHAFALALRRGARRSLRSLLRGDASQVHLAVTGLGAVVRADLEAVDPNLAALVPSDIEVTLVDGNPGAAARDLSGRRNDLGALAIVLGLFSAALALGVLVTSRRLRAGVGALGLGIAAAGALVHLAVSMARARALDALAPGEARTVGRATFAALAGDLRTTAWVVLAAGVATALLSRVLPR